MKLKLTETKDGVLLPVKAKPNANGNLISGVVDGALKVSVTATPEKGKANSAIIKLLAKNFGIAKRRFELVSGSTNSNKKFFVAGLSAREVNEVLGF